MDTCRLHIEFAESFKSRSATGARPWSKHSAGSSAHAAATAKKGATKEEPVKIKEKKAKEKPGAKKSAEEAAPDDLKRQEFFNLMKARSTVKSYANDELLPANDAALPAKQASKARRADRAADSSDDDDDDVQDLSAIVNAPKRLTGKDGHAKPGAQPKAAKRKARAAEAESDDGEGASAESDDDGAHDDVMDDDISDLAYLRSRMRASLDADNDEDDNEGEGQAFGRGVLAPVQHAGASSDDEDGDDDEEDDDGDEDDDAAHPTGAEDAAHDSEDAAQGIEERSRPGESSGRASHAFSEDPAELILQTGRLFLRNLPYTATEADLTEAFSAYGPVSDVHVVQDRVAQRSKGFAHVQFTNPQDAVAAFEAVDGSIFQGRLVHILPGKRPLVREPPAEDSGGNNKSFKEQREAARKADAGNRSAWSTLYMRQDTVAEAVAAILGIDKSELMNPEASDVAVRLALGETQVVALTKQGLEEAGVNIAALEAAAAASGKASQSQHVARSKNVLLLKNLPYSAEAGELSALFEKFGGVVRIILPETRTMAVVELADDESARRAFKGLAYKRYHHVPLYLEWAPRDIFAAEARAEEVAKKATHRKNEVPAHATEREPPLNAKAAAVLTGLVDAEASEADGVTLFVKNLSFETTQEQLRAHFDKAASAAGGALRSARIATVKRGADKTLSRGFGFVELSDRDTAKAVLRSLQGSTLDSHKLELQISATKGSGTDAVKAKREGKLSDTKILVKNLAFEATAKDIRGLLEAFGHVKSCRLPQKFDGSKRGFAFVEFGTKGEAKKAVESVHGIHLYGRRLLLEYAKEDEGLDELRAKTAAKFGDGPVSKRRKTSHGPDPNFGDVSD